MLKERWNSSSTSAAVTCHIKICWNISASPSKEAKMRQIFWLNFTCHSQKAKEMEEAFADELQLLACKVINKKPDFCLDLDATLKQRYTSQLYYCNNTSIAKTLLMQMLQMTFTQFHNELAWVLGTCQWAMNKASSKSVMTSVDVQSKEDNPPTRSQKKQNVKISAQSSQIKDLCTKLGQVVAENTQIKKFLSPASLQKAFTSALQATNKTSNEADHKGTRKKFLVRHQEPQLSAGTDSTMVPEKSCQYCKDMGHKIKNCPRLAARNEFLAAQQEEQQKKWVKLKTPVSQGHGYVTWCLFHALEACDILVQKNEEINIIQYFNVFIGFNVDAQM